MVSIPTVEQSGYIVFLPGGVWFGQSAWVLARFMGGETDTLEHTGDLLNPDHLSLSLFLSLKRLSVR